MVTPGAPAHLETEGTLMTGVGFTVTVAVVVLVHPPVVPVMVYVVVVAGLAVTLDPVVALNPVAGLQV